MGRHRSGCIPEWTEEPVGLGLNINIRQVLSLSKKSGNLLGRVAESLTEKHLTWHIVHRTRELLRHLDAPETPPGTENTTANMVSHMGTQENERIDMTNEVDRAGMNFVDRYNMYNLISSYGFGFEETYFGQAALSNLDLWPE